MPSVWLDDDELVDLILERPEVLPMVVEKLRKQRDDAEESNSTLWSSLSKLRQRIRELEEEKDK